MPPPRQNHRRDAEVSSATAPDLETGYMIMGYDAPNRWRTGVECVLVRTREGAQAEYAYLSHECRAEKVCSEIFDQRNYEFVAVKAWSGVYYLRGGSYNYGFSPSNNLKKKKPECVYEKVPHDNVFVHCPQRSPRYLSFGEALELLQSDDAKHQKKLYLEVSFHHSGYGYTLYVPSRYTNFSHPELSDKKYIQPISGYALYEENGVISIAYVAAHMKENSVEGVEFRIRDMVSFIETKNKSSRLFPLFKILDKLLFSAFFTIDDFCSVRRFPDGDCRFFVYEPPS